MDLEVSSTSVVFKTMGLGYLGSVLERRKGSRIKS